MTTTIRLALAPIAFAIAATLSLAHAQEESLQPQTYNHVMVVTGGVTAGESASAKRMAPHYALRVVMSDNTGTYYVADRVTISQGRQIVAEVPNAGPWLMMDLPPGRYTVEAHFGTTELKRHVRVAARGAGSTVYLQVPQGAN